MVLEYNKHSILEEVVVVVVEVAVVEGAVVLKTKIMAIDKSPKTTRHLADSAPEYKVEVVVAVEEVGKAAEVEEEAALGVSLLR